MWDDKLACYMLLGVRVIMEEVVGQAGTLGMRVILTCVVVAMEAS